MSPDSTPIVSPRGLFLEIDAAFRRRPDAASILQGVRTFRRGRPHVRIVLVPSPKNGGHFIPCEGRLEAAFALNLEIDPSVSAYRVQPFKVLAPSGRALICDFAIKRTDNSYTVVDVKPSGQLDRPTVKERMRVVRGALAAACIPHQIVTESELERQPARSIREQLRKGATVPLSQDNCKRLLDRLGSKLMSVQALRNEAVDLDLPPSSVEKLALLGHLAFPVSAPWCALTLVGATHAIHHTIPGHWGTVHAIRVPL